MNSPLSKPYASAKGYPNPSINLVDDYTPQHFVGGIVERFVTFCVPTNALYSSLFWAGVGRRVFCSFAFSSPITQPTKQSIGVLVNTSRLVNNQGS